METLPPPPEPKFFKQLVKMRKNFTSQTVINTIPSTLITSSNDLIIIIQGNPLDAVLLATEILKLNLSIHDVKRPFGLQHIESEIIRISNIKKDKSIPSSIDRAPDDTTFFRRDSLLK
jgi:hypothetical protein